MFTGIVEEVGKVTSIREERGTRRMTVSASNLIKELKAGDSIYVPRGTIHRNQNLTDKPARAINLNIMDKDQPQTEQITN